MIRQLRALGRGLRRSGPIYAMVQVTARCNLRCRMCQVWQLEHGDATELPAGRYREMARVMARCGLGVVTLAGEPLLRTDLPELVAAFAQRGLAVRVQTNGLALDEALMADLLRAGLSGISISLHSLDSARMEWLARRPGVLEAVQGSIELVARATRGRRGFLRVLNAVLYRENLEELMSLADYAASRGFLLSVIPIHSSPLREEEQQFVDRLPQRMALRTEDERVAQRLADQLVRRRRFQRGLLNSSRYLSLLPQALAGRAPAWPCLAGTLYCFVDHNGLAAPCHELEPVGSIFDRPVYESLRDGDLGGTSVQARAGCPGCLLPCWTELSLMFSDGRAFREAVGVNLGLG